MKKISVFTLYLALYFITYGVGATAWSFMTDYLKSSGYFGDTADSYGSRHIIWIAIGILLTICSIIRISMWMEWFWNANKKKYN